MILSYEISLNEDEDYLVKTLNDNYFYFILPLRNTYVHFYTTNITFSLIIIPSILLLYYLFFLFIFLFQKLWRARLCGLFCGFVRAATHLLLLLPFCFIFILFLHFKNCATFP